MSLKEHKNHALDDEQVIALVKGKARVVTYDQLHRYKNIDQLLDPYGAVFILYQRRKNFGHWVALFKRKDKHGSVEIEFFDPYGNMIDDPLLWTSKSKRKELNMDYPHLTKLLLEAPRGYDIIYNQHPFQKEGAGINTCGRHCALRLQHRNLKLNDYVKLFDNVKSPETDDIVTAATMFDLK